MNALVPVRHWIVAPEDNSIPRVSSDFAADLIAHYREVRRRLNPPPKPPGPPPSIVWEPRRIARAFEPTQSPTKSQLPQPHACCKADPDEDDAPDVRPFIRDIKAIVAAHYGLKVLDLISERRTADIVMPRHVAIFLAHDMTGRSLPEIGRRFGGRDHTTALHAVRKIKAMIEKDPAFAEKVSELRRMCVPPPRPPMIDDVIVAQGVGVQLELAF